MDLELTPGTHLQCRCPHPVHLRVQAGRLWLTIAGLAEDHFLMPGESLRVAAGERATLGCDSAIPVRLQWQSGPASGWARRWHQWREARALRRVLATLSESQMRDAGLPCAQRRAELVIRERQALQDVLSTRWAQG